MVNVLLGYEDEIITEKFKDQQNFTVNKIGGKPDYPTGINLEPPICPLCQVPRPLVVQIYAPLENSTFHRTLYLFACINPNCWSSSESWLCLRVQTQEQIKDTAGESKTTESYVSATDWCSDADDWGDDNNANSNEQNGNIINNPEKISDDDDESCSLEDSIRSGLGNLTVDDRNANKGAQGGAVGRLNSPAASAEIEGNEGEVISIDTPTYPQHDITALLQEVTPLPHDICQSGSRRKSLIQFTPYFMSVWEETYDKNTGNISDRHVKELIQEYQQKNEEITNLSSPEGGGVDYGSEASEKYEKSNPAHGDKMFHHFLSKIQANSGQILRYSRESAPLLLYPLKEPPKQCQHCCGETDFEFQLVPTIISKLKLAADSRQCARLDFGTVLVYTCRKSCWSSETAVRTEVIVLQTEV